MSTALTNELERRKLVRLRVRPDLNITPQKYEGKTHYVVKDPVGLKYYRFNEQEYFVVQHFDGKHTMEETQKAFEREFRPHRLTLEDLESFSQQLLTAGLVQHETAQAGKQLFEKRRKQRRTQKIATLTNILYIKLPVFDPDRLLNRMIKYLWWIFTPWFLIASVGLMLSAVILVLTHFKTFYDNLPEYQEFFRWNTLLYLWIALGVVKVIHEFGHGLSCRAFGGECHEMGALFLCFSPCLYCNVSDSWTLPDKWKRIIISFAGIYVELVIASIATWVWWNSQAHPTVRHVALCVMVLCSVSTFVFNANPLMRFDGYYILADWLEIPNLRDRSNRLLKNLTNEYALGIEVQPEPYMAPWRKVLFISYAIGSYIYRWVVTFSILYFMANWLKPYRLGVVSKMLAVASLASMVGWPLYRLFKGLWKRGRLPDMKRFNVSISAGLLAAVLFVFFVVPLPVSRVRQTGLVQFDPESIRKEYMREDAILTALHVRNGERVAQGQLIAEFRSPKLEMQQVQYQGQYRTSLTEYQALGRMLASTELNDPEERKQVEAERQKALADMNQYKVQAEELQKQIDELGEKHGLRAGQAGVVLGAPRPEDVGKEWMRENPEPFCSVGDPNKLIVLVPVSSSDYQVLRDDLKLLRELPVVIRVPGRGTDYVHGRITRLPESDAKDVPLSLTHQAGGPLAVKPATSNPNVHVPQSQQYLVTVEIPQADADICPGALVKVKVRCKWRTCAWWVWHAITSAFDLDLG